MLSNIIMIALMVNLVCLVLIWPRRQLLAAKFFMLVLLAQWFWQLGYFIEIKALTIEQAIFWDNVQFPPYTLVSPAWLYMSRTLANKPLFKGSGHPLITFSVPILIFVALFVDDQFHLLRAADSNQFTNNLLTYEFGLLVYLSTFWSYALVLSSFTLLFQFQRSVNPTYRLQILLIGFGILFPLVMSIPTFMGVTFFGVNDITPFTFSVANLAVMFGLFRLHAFEFQIVGQLPVLAQLPVGIVIFDHRHRVIEWNSLAESMTNVTIKEPGLPFSSLPFAEAAKLDENVTWKFGGSFYEIQYRELETAERLDSYLVMLKDVTALIKQQTTLKLSNQTLNDLLLELKQTQNKMLESEKHKSMVGLIQRLAHEFNTPLGNLITSLDGMKHTDSPLEYMPLIESNVRSVIGLIERIKEISNIHSTEKAVRFHLNESVESALQIQHYKDKPCAIEFSSDISAEMTVHWPRTAFESILTHLLDNAREHAFTSESAQARVEVSAEFHAEQIKLTVKDNGLGIDPSKQKSLFQPFSDENSMSITSGIGLFSVQQWVTQNLQGSITFEPIAPFGARFTITCPLNTESTTKEVL